ncbi:ATP-NAD kinase-like domain-containing protein [Phycomyces nitens]|nr:ATP-NAD kinase-like domain-containing protein [Phycomyces nitens]
MAQNTKVKSPWPTHRHLAGTFNRHADPLLGDGVSNHDKPKSRHTQASHLSDTAEVVRQVAKKMGKARITWENPQSVLIITKPNDTSLVRMTRELAEWLIKTPRYGQPSGITVYVDDKLKDCKTFCKKLNKHPERAKKLRYWTPEMVSLQPKLFDFIVTLGGDGTVLFASWLFQTFIPPVIPFHLGSLGFLTPFHFEKYDAYITHAMEKGVRINLRGRLTCTVYRHVSHTNASGTGHAPSLRQVKRDPVTGKITVGDWCTPRKKSLKKFGEVDGEDFDEEDEDDQDLQKHYAHESETTKDTSGVPKHSLEAIDTSTNEQIKTSCTPASSSDTEEAEEADYRPIPCFTTVPVEQYQVINDLVIDRGPSPYMSLLELFGDDKHLTTVQADGLAISTPTGSTAYSLSAGGSLTHPEIRATLITPICPHTLSFRPTLVPDSMELRICVPYNSRNTAWASFDGRGRVELRQGDHIKVTASKYPFPTVCKDDQATDWFNSLSNCLHWNKRQRQKSFAVVESHLQSNKPNSGRSTARTSPSIRTSPTSRKHSTQSSTASSTSEMSHDEVFAIFGDEDFSSHSNVPANTSASGYESSIDSTPDDGSSSDEDDSEDEPLTGWTDEEILRGRYKSTIAKGLENININKTE